MNKNRISEPNVRKAADYRLQKNLSESIPVFLVLGLCLLAVSLFSNQSYIFEENSIPAITDIAEKYVWITGSPKVKEGLYLLTPEQLKETFPELLPLVTIPSAPPESDSMVSAIRYKSNVPQPVNLPPAVANIFFEPISINRAGKEILSTLPGIGPMLAERIVLRREAKGPFRSKDELLHISGIGPKKLARLVDTIILD
jgi:competence ComEA-like helix-hairpin-helix protein